MTYTGNSNRFFLHGFEQCTLSFRRCTIYLISKNDIGKYRTADKLKFSLLIQDFGTYNIRRHKVGSKLYTAVSKT